MKLEKQVCNLSQSKRLNELLVLGQWKNIDFNFYWIKTQSSNAYFLTGNPGAYVYPVDHVPTFTVSELCEMLPVDFISFKVSAGNEWCCHKLKDGRGEFDMFKSQYGKTQAECCASMVIHLLENNLLSVETCNKSMVA